MGTKAIVLIDHGSRVKEANEFIEELCEKYKLKHGVSIVEPAHMELAEPSILTACEQCIHLGANQIICHPFFLGNGRHVQEDIPRLINEVRIKYPDIEIILTKTTGSNPAIIDLIHETIMNVEQ